jgi:acyl-CoA synthetase (AMP-forming)/AMP-acid ligase II
MPDSCVSLKGKILSGDREFSQAQLLDSVARAAAGLSVIGIGTAATVAIMLRNGFPFFEASMAANAVGGYAVPINWHFQADEAGYILRDSQAQVLVVHADLFPQVCAGIPEGVRRQSVIPESAARVAAIIETVFGFRPDGEFRTVVTGPMYQTAPNAYGMFAARNGGFCILQPRFDPEGLLQLIEQYRITHLHMVPTMFVRLFKLSEEIKRTYDLSSLTFVVHAAAPCPPEVKRQMIAWWGPVINEYYGATEMGAVVFHTSEEALRKPGTVGRPITGSIMRIYDEQATCSGQTRSEKYT